MDLTTEMYVIAGLGAVGLGSGAIVSQPRRSRSRIFAALCAALALWSLGVALSRTSLAPEAPWHLLFLLGSCSAAALGLQFCLHLTGQSARRWLAPAYAAAGLVWLAAWTPAHEWMPGFNYIALAVLGSILVTALAHVLKHLLSLRRGPQRNAFQLFFVGAMVAVIGGLSDFVPHEIRRLPRIGPLTLLVLLLVISAMVVRYRFLDVHAFLARGLALVASAGSISMLLISFLRVPADRFLPLFLVSMAIVACAALAGRMLLAGEGIGTPVDAAARALTAASRGMPLARKSEEVWSSLGEGIGVLGGGIRVAVYLRSSGPGAFERAYRHGPVSNLDETVPAESALPILLDADQAPMTRIFLEEEIRSGDALRSRLAARALEQVDALEIELAVPLHREGVLAGWIGVGGGTPERYLKGEVAAALLALGSQAVASLERLEAVSESRRRESLAVVGEMAAGLAHEIRNPVGAIRGAAQVLCEERDAARAREMLEVIEEETARLGRVVGEFLDYARPGTQHREAVDLAELARRTLRLAEAAGTGIRASVQVEPGALRAVGDPDQLLRAMANLVRNAREAAGPEGMLRIRIAREGETRVAIRFEDDGPGIPPERVQGLFKPFQSTKRGGTGLGLALVHRVIETHGGTVVVEGRPGRGAAFTLVLPAEELKA
ncbi:MAG: ATP-binding protein [Acidobacteria bacterium]|nr:ATP-binding protein [Acidobacteriota bacterium]